MCTPYHGVEIKYILSEKGGEFTSQQFTWLAEELEFIKLYISPHTPTGNSSSIPYN